MQFMNISSVERDKLRRILVDLFLCANKEMFKNNIDCIVNGVSERSICACLKSEFDKILPDSIFDKYYADVEYNRGSGRTLKSYEANDHIFKMTCDFILHSRGKLEPDNLICLEMKKKSYNQGLMDNDRQRLKSLTMPGGCQIVGRNLVVRDYCLGIFYVIDNDLSQIELEYYSDGALIREEIISLDEASKYKVLYSFLPNRNITFFNMNFGDSFLIKDCQNSLLVDCGSKNQNKLRKSYMVNLIYNEMKFFNNDLLITHYHFDHLSAILDLSNNGIKFNNIYVRCLDTKCFSFDFYSAFTELLSYVIRSHDYDTFLKWINPKGLINLLFKSGKVRGVNSVSNKKIYIGGSVANVLWPSPSKINYKDLDKIANKIDLILFGDDSNDDSFELIKIRIRKIYRYYKTIYERLIDNENGVSQEELNAVLRNIDFVDNDITEKDVETFIKTVKIPGYLVGKLSDLENHLSIVFEIDSKLLMCGDADNDALSKAVLCFANNHNLNVLKTDEFDIIKVPHHGTSNYFYNFKNQKAVYLIPNSKLYKTTWVIDYRYVCGSAKCISLNNGYKSACPIAKTCRYKCPYAGVLDCFRIYF